MIEPGKAHNTAPSELDAPPALKLAILTCMDARINLWDLFHLGLGDAHVIRNAGAIATPDVIRSLAASQRLLETEEIVVIAHTDCGIHRIAPTEFAKQVGEEIGEVPDWTVPATEDPHTTLALTLELLRAAPELKHRDKISGWVLDVQSGELSGPDGD
jgi:carbonic anhydrase